MTKLITAIFILITACRSPKDRDDCHYGIKFKNNTDKVLYIDSSSDTIIQTFMDPRPYYKDNKVFPYAGNNGVEFGYSTFIRNGRPMCAEDLYKADKKIYVFVFDSLKIGSKDWNDITKKYLVTKRYDFTIADLRKTNFTIEYY